MHRRLDPGLAPQVLGCASKPVFKKLAPGGYPEGRGDWVYVEWDVEGFQRLGLTKQEEALAVCLGMSSGWLVLSSGL